MASREDLYRKFGPLIVEAVVHITFQEINNLRSAVGLPERTVQQTIDAIENELDRLSKYNWMPKFMRK